MANIVLTGFMGTGKSTVGRLLARDLGLEFVDIDAIVEKEAGMSVSDIFALHGERWFRGMEKGVVERLASGELGEGLVVSAGGGVVVDRANRALLRKWAVVICLKASVDEIIRRVGGGSTRPLLDTADRRKSIEKLLNERAGAYGDCDLEVDTTDLGAGEVASSIRTYLEKRHG